MEQLNRIELAGRIGTIKITSVGDARIARFSLATNVTYKDKHGTPVIETTWHNVSAWESPQCPNLGSLAKGDSVHVIGRIRTSRFTAADGSERTIYEVVAGKVERIAADLEF